MKCENGVYYVLLPCPFCGGEAGLHKVFKNDECFVMCHSCFGETDVKADEQEAIEAWNRRVES